jgi:hypothetical protein
VVYSSSSPRWPSEGCMARARSFPAANRGWLGLDRWAGEGKDVVAAEDFGRGIVAGRVADIMLAAHVHLRGDGLSQRRRRRAGRRRLASPCEAIAEGDVAVASRQLRREGRGTPPGAVCLCRHARARPSSVCEKPCGFAARGGDRPCGASSPPAGSMRGLSSAPSCRSVA